MTPVGLPKSGTMLPYSPGMSGPGPTARLALIGAAFLLVACLVLGCIFLYSGADRTPPRPTATPRAGLVDVAAWGASSS